MKGNVRRNENFKESTSFSSRCSFKTDLMGTQKTEKNESSTLDKTSPVISADKGNEITSISVQSQSSNSLENVEKEEAESTDVKPVEVEKQWETQRVKSTLTKEAHKVKSAPGKGRSKALHVR